MNEILLIIFAILTYRISAKEEGLRHKELCLIYIIKIS